MRGEKPKLEGDLFRCGQVFSRVGQVSKRCRDNFPVGRTNVEGQITRGLGNSLSGGTSVQVGQLCKRADILILSNKAEQRGLDG